MIIESNFILCLDENFVHKILLLYKKLLHAKIIDSPKFCLHILRIYHAEDQAFPIIIVVRNRKQKMKGSIATHAHKDTHIHT